MRRSAADLRADENALLCYLAAHVERTASRRIAMRTLAVELGLSIGQVRHLLRSLNLSGAIVIEACHLENGGQIENSYEVTPSGLARLARLKDRG